MQAIALHEQLAADRHSPGSQSLAFLPFLTRITVCAGKTLDRVRM